MFYQWLLTFNPFGVVPSRLSTSRFHLNAIPYGKGRFVVGELSRFQVSFRKTLTYQSDNMAHFYQLGALKCV